MAIVDFDTINDSFISRQFIELSNGTFVRLDRIVEYHVHFVSGARKVRCRAAGMNELVDVHGENADALLELAMWRTRMPAARRKFYPPCPYCAQHGRQSCHELRDAAR